MTRYDYAANIDELLDKALNELSPTDYRQLLDDIDIMLAERED